MGTVFFIITVAIAVAMTAYFVSRQINVYRSNKKELDRLSKFFDKTENYSTLEHKAGICIRNVAAEGSELKLLIGDINEYIGKSKGTVAFSIIQNKTERRLSMVSDMATSRLTFPTLIGLQGTFAGAFVGLLIFLVGTFLDSGITDSAIQSLIAGVIVAMIASFVGLILLVKSHQKASEATNKADRDKNEFYEWVQNELMPSVDVSMVEAIGQLHETIDRFEPSFSGIIAQFREAFSDITNVFGNNFRQSVRVVANAVDEMGRNMDRINQNVRLEQEILNTIRSGQMKRGLNAFVDATERFEALTSSLDLFEKARRLMLVSAQETINIQRSYSESLQIPLKVAADINVILNRITNFEKNIEGLGTSIAQTQLVGNQTVEQIKACVKAINSKQQVAKEFADTANANLERYFAHHVEELGRIAQRYNDALESHLADYSQMMEQAKLELKERKQEFTEALEQKFSLEEIRNDFSSLNRLSDIERKMDEMAGKIIGRQELSEELEEIRQTLGELDEKVKSANEGKSKSFFGSILGTK